MLYNDTLLIYLKSSVLIGCVKINKLHEKVCPTLIARLTHSDTYSIRCTSKGHDFHERLGKVVEALKGIGVGGAGKAQTQSQTGPGSDVFLGLAE